MLNRRLHAARLESRFIATVFSVYDARTRRLTLANSGGPYPILVRDGIVQSIRIGGIPLGLYPDTEYEEITLDLQPGDTVLFASDGILESENAQQEEFGFDRLSAVLASVSPKHSASDIADKTSQRRGCRAWRRPNPPCPPRHRPLFVRFFQAANHLLTCCSTLPHSDSGSVRRNRDTFALNATCGWRIVISPVTRTRSS